MSGAGALTFQEFTMREPLPLATIHDAVLNFLRDREDAVVFGAQAVNAYVNDPRMTQGIDLISSRAAELAEELRNYLSGRFHIAVRIREVGEGRGYRLFQVQKSGNRHLVDLRAAETLPPARRIAQVLVMEPADLIASKVVSYHQRRGKPKSGSDWRDLAMLMLTFPELKRDPGPVTDRLQAAGADRAVMTVWAELVASEIEPENEDDEF
ncbi:MAG: nucleotidyl transferase AbiEii/AbiGii toxin family protein [Acidobacteriota bacterium]|nr:nucleotidyl transferase AbiEii/AbiGii toxin family protein [Acidobacteriota bacterium]